jgi:hypothetical protein
MAGLTKDQTKPYTEFTTKTLLDYCYSNVTDPGLLNKYKMYLKKVAGKDFTHDHTFFERQAIDALIKTAANNEFIEQ